MQDWEWQDGHFLLFILHHSSAMSHNDVCFYSTDPSLKRKKIRFINSELIIGSLFIPLSSYNAYSPKKNPDHNFLPTAKHDLLNYHGNF